MDEKDLSDLLGKICREIYPFLKMQAFRQQRVKFINENMSLRYPVELQMGSYLLLHLIPGCFSVQQQCFDIKKVVDPSLWLYPIGISEKNTFEDFNFDGLIFAPGTHLKPAYTQLFRSGIIEALSTIARTDKIISLIQLQQDIYTGLKHYLNTLTVLEVKPPIYLFTKVINARDVKLSPQDIAQCGSEEKARSRFILRNDLEFPEIVINDLDTDLNELLKPVIDVFWNVFGYPGAPKAQVEKQTAKEL